jgi:exopolyphosphatase / guanosine-5'-triphosphate,3'-diphosphate pyrophosphatase
MRVVYLLTAAMPGVMPSLKWTRRDDGGFTLNVPKVHAALTGERPTSRMAQLAKVSGFDLKLAVGD